MISVIIRTHNEERWIEQCIKKIIIQKCSFNVEIVIVDNCSHDATVEKAMHLKPDIKVVTINEYYPGKAINIGIEESKGEFIAILSAHCLPINDQWLQNLVENMNDPDVAGVYGRQIPMSYTDLSDKRDLLVTFGLDRIEQIRGSFFHNANSLIRREVWKKIPFDENLTNIEDRIWGKNVIKANFKIIYEPDACVFHYHGIHHKNNQKRLENVVKIIEKYDNEYEYKSCSPFSIEELKVCAIIPFRSKDIEDDFIKRELFDNAYKAIKKSKYINKIILFSDDDYLNYYVKKYEDVGQPILREKYLEKLRLVSVFAELLNKLGKEFSYFPDIVIPVELIYPFRPHGLFDDLICKLIYNNMDTVIPGYKEYRACWKKNGTDIIRLDNNEMPRIEREPLYVGVLGLGFATYPELLRRKVKYGEKIGIIQYDNPLIKMEIRNKNQMKYFDMFLQSGLLSD